MIKCEVVFYGDEILIGKFTVYTGDVVCIYIGSHKVKGYWDLEQAISYCLKHQS